MSKKIYLQISIFIAILLIVSLIYLMYFQDDNKIVIDPVSKKPKDELVKSEEDLITKMKYFSEDNKGNKYEIESDYGTINPEQSNLISMSKVKAVVYLNNGEKIFIKSDKANYNNDNNDTVFKGSVFMNYNDHKIKAENLDLSFRNNLATLYDKVYYNSSISNLFADKILIDFMSKKTKILMNDDNKNILVRSNINDGNN